MIKGLQLSILLIVVVVLLSVNGQAPPSAPTNVTATGMTTSISLTWELPQGSSDTIDRYEINCTFTINECGETEYNNYTIEIFDGSLRSYTIINSYTTPVEEDSSYFITMIAFSNGIGSVSSDITFTTTMDAAPGVPQNVRIASVNVANISIQWDRVICQDRNGRTDSYVVFYYPTSDPSNKAAQTISGTGDSDRMFGLTGLRPLTNYTFEIEASNPLIRVPGVVATITVTTTAPQDLGVLLAGILYQNNSIVTLDDIGGRFSGPALFCLTPNVECCTDSETPNASTVTREWYLPDRRQVQSAGTVFSISQVSGAIGLYRNGATSISGVFRCEIPDATTLRTSRNIYVGIYTLGVGSPSIISVLLERSTNTLTCTSTGGPPTTVIWRKSGVPVNDSLFQQSQVLIDAQAATFQNLLHNNDISDFLGTFTCEVSNARGAVQESVELNGVSIVRDKFRVGEGATARCFSDVSASRIEWLNNGVVMASTTNSSTQQLDLVFSLVNDSIHNQVFICRVTGTDLEELRQNFTVKVNVPPDVINASVQASGIARAGMSYTLICTASRTVDGLVNSPSAMWTTAGQVVASDGNGVTVSTLSTAMVIITFDPLRTSHDGIYRCNGTLISPALKTPLTRFSTEINHVQISTPEIVIAVPSGPVFAGGMTPLILICNISINPATDTTFTMDVTWYDDEEQLLSQLTSNRVTVSPVSGSDLSYTIFLTIFPPSTADSAFICRARASSPPNQQSFVTRSEQGESKINVSVKVPYPPTISIIQSTRLMLIGQPLTLNCSASIQEGITGTPILTWTKDGVQQTAEFSSGSLVLSFPSLHKTHSGLYICNARLIIPEAGVDVSGTNTTSVLVQIPTTNISVESRLPSTDGCGKVTILNCTINPEDGFITTPTITWTAPDGNYVSANESANPRLHSQTNQLIFSDISAATSGLYSCFGDSFQASTIIFVDIDVPGIPKNLTCAGGSTPSELTFFWNSPSMLEHELISYQVQVKGLRHGNETREVVQFEVISFTTEMRVITLGQGLVAEVPYNVKVKALNLVGCGAVQQVYCFTQEGVPPSPTNIMIERFNSTSIGVSWTKFTLVELKGLASYIVTYSPVIGSRKRQLGIMITIPWTQNQVSISNLQEGAVYNITVSTSTTAGTSAPASALGPIMVNPILTSSTNRVAVISGVVAVLMLSFVIVAIIIAAVVVLVYLRSKRQATFQPNQESQLYYEEPRKMNAVSSTENELELYAVIEDDHEYELLDGCNNTYQALASMSEQLQPLSSVGDYDFTTCPAYISVKTTCIHGNYNEYAVPFFEPTTAQGTKKETQHPQSVK